MLTSRGRLSLTAGEQSNRRADAGDDEAEWRPGPGQHARANGVGRRVIVEHQNQGQWRGAQPGDDQADDDQGSSHETPRKRGNSCQDVVRCARPNSAMSTPIPATPRPANAPKATPSWIGDHSPAVII